MKAQLIQKAVAVKLPFALYQLPGSTAKHFTAQSGSDVNDPHAALQSQKGFAFFPFDLSRSEPLFLRADVQCTLSDTQVVERYIANEKPREAFGSDREYCTTKEEYLNSLSAAMSQMPRIGIEKFIFSAVNSVPYPGTDSAYALFTRLCEKYPNAFVYLFQHEKCGLWIGATPETLLKNNGEKAFTMALAGTTPKQENGNYNWKKKELEEQKYVSDYIEEVLTDLQLSYSKKGPETKEAGPVAHLHTSFSVNTLKHKGKAFDLLQRLHPTPAVCGKPKDKALDFVTKTEKHNRTYYTGFLGPAEGDGCFEMFVNLRCMKVFHDELQIYAGGGITADSVPESEWREIELKAFTLKAAVNG